MDISKTDLISLICICYHKMVGTFHYVIEVYDGSNTKLFVTKFVQNKYRKIWFFVQMAVQL
jgi:hypothetical protein